jgi:hypothetical protein
MFLSVWIPEVISIYRLILDKGLMVKTLDKIKG